MTLLEMIERMIALLEAERKTTSQAPTTNSPVTKRWRLAP
jgi:hypothetical protein